MHIALSHLPSLSLRHGDLCFGDRDLPLQSFHLVKAKYPAKDVDLEATHNTARVIRVLILHFEGQL